MSSIKHSIEFVYYFAYTNVEFVSGSKNNEMKHKQRQLANREINSNNAIFNIALSAAILNYWQNYGLLV